jgi:hypothetical protein
MGCLRSSPTVPVGARSLEIAKAESGSEQLQLLQHLATKSLWECVREPPLLGVLCQAGTDKGGAEAGFMRCWARFAEVTPRVPDRRNSFGVVPLSLSTQRRLAGSSPTLGLWPNPLRGRATHQQSLWRGSVCSSNFSLPQYALDALSSLKSVLRTITNTGGCLRWFFVN